MAAMDKVKVAVRVRPFNRREIDLGTKCVVDMDNSQTMLFHPSTGMKDSDGPITHKKAPKTFAFDHCFWSLDENIPKFASQETVFNSLGKEVLERAFEGYNACIFAYGQTGSGKSFTMMGSVDNKGIIPRLCDQLFENIAANPDPSICFKVEVSYMEIYNEKVRDLLDPNGRHNLKVREHTILGPYVDGLSTLAVSSFKDIENLMVEGNKSRTVAATNMNSESSRSHAVFNIICTQTVTDFQSGVSGEKVSKMSMVDLAGSERAQKTGAVGERLKEGSNINKSLTTLGLVISALADQASGKAKNKFVPYRDSVLTWLLKDNLGGNSKTVMVATLSPSADNYEETLSTLRYADRAKRIVNHAVVNEDPNARIIRELREEVESLRDMLNQAKTLQADDLADRLAESEKLMRDMGKTWEEKLKETENLHQERQAALEKMGISVQTSGIKVEQGKYFLVNLNADPSLNELLVYYLKAHTLVGRPDAPVEQDIQLSGLGIVSEHCCVDIADNEVYITPLDGARTCVNGRTITEKTKVKHGDRILWGNNHFFRINCPKANSPSTETPETIDYDFAQHELMTQQMGDDPIQEAITVMEKQHEEDKQEALDRQRMMYERQMQMLRNQLISPSTPSTPYPPFFPMTPSGIPGANMQSKYQQWAQEREKMFKQSLLKLKEEVMKANQLVIEANTLSDEMGKETEFSVTLQIPGSNLSPNRKRGAFVSEPAILVKRKAKYNQIWAMEKFENKVIDMREMYQDRKEKGLPMRDKEAPAMVKGDPFYESQENHNLIGVANIFLETLFYDVKLDYQVPIISQQGEVAGRLHIELSRVAGTLPDRNSDEVSSEASMDSSRTSLGEMDDESGAPVGAGIVCRVCIKEARGLPPALSHFVFCQYSFWGYPEPAVVPPVVDSEIIQKKKTDGMSFRFDHKKEYTVYITEEFMEHCAEGALSVEVWGHRSMGFGAAVPGWEIDQVQAKSRSIMDRWSELKRKIDMWVEIHELNEQGEYMPVEVVRKPEVLTGGIFQLRQGHSRRILVQVQPVQNSGTLPIICESIQHVSIGCVCARSKLQKGLDSYQEVDLGHLRDKWSEALEKRREYLDEQLQKIMNKEGKTDTDAEREQSLIDQWVCLTEERNAVLVPAAGCDIPGAPADWDPPNGMEPHIPVIFLDLNADDMSTPSVKEGMQAAGINSILPKEHGTKCYTLPFVKNSEKDVCALTSWDSSIHDSLHLNRVTPDNERVYLILKTVVRLSHPAAMELVLRKRICINVYKRQSISERLKKRIGKAVMPAITGVVDYFQEALHRCGVSYEVVSNIPKSSEDLEDRESLAQIAASQNDQHTSDGETYIEKYIRGVSAVESILTLDRLRQEVAIKELLAARGRPLRKATSVPNIHNLLSSPRNLEEQLKADSIQDLTFPNDSFRQFPFDQYRHRPNGSDKDASALPNKPAFNLASPKGGLNGQQGLAGMKPPLKTLVEEQHHREAKPLLNQNEDSDEDEFSKLKQEECVDPLGGKPVSPRKLPLHNSDSIDSDEFQEFQEFQTDEKTEQEEVAGVKPQGGKSSEGGIPHSNTADSFVEVQAKGFAPSVTSSGYGSQAVSTHTLSSEDSTSLRSISIDDTPDFDRRDMPSKGQEDNGVRANIPQSQSLIDMAVPCDLDSPIQPFSPSSETHHTKEDSDTNTESQESVVDKQMLEKTSEVQNASLDASVEGTDSVFGEPQQVPSMAEKEKQSEVPNNSLDVSGKASDVVSQSEPRIDDVDADVNTDVSHTTDTVDSVTTTVVVTPSEQVVNESSTEETLDDSLNNDTSQQNISVDFYSEKALDDLEGLSDNEVTQQNDSFAETSTPVKKGREPSDDSFLDGSKPSPIKEEITEHGTTRHAESPKKAVPAQGEPVISPQPAEEKVKLRRKSSGGSTKDRAMHRRSWHEKSDRRPAASIDDSPRQPDFRITKTPSMDFNRPGSLKKLRSTDTRGNKTSPSPVKATYRPASMAMDVSPVDPLADLDADEYASDNDNDDSMSICSFGSRADLHRLGEVPVPSWVQVGEPVIVLFSTGGSKNGTVQFVGQTEFASGNWVGVELETRDGKNDGSVKGVRYFKCRKAHGIFVRHDKLIMDKKRKSGKINKMSPSMRRSLGNLSSPSPQKENLPALTADNFTKSTSVDKKK